MPIPIREVARVGSYAYRKARNRRVFSLKPYFRSMMPKSVGYGRRRTRRGKTPFARAVRKVILNTTERCYKSRVVAQGTGVSINHDTLKGWAVWDGSTTSLFPAQGLSDGERIGDEIYVTGMMLRCSFEVPYDRRNTKIKLWWVPHNSDQGNPADATQFQHVVSGNTFLDPIQTDRWRGIKYLGMHQLKSTDQSTSDESDKTIIRKFWIPMYKKVTFTSDSTTKLASGLPENGALIATAYDTYSTFTTDTVVSRGEIVATLYYKCP